MKESQVVAAAEEVLLQGKALLSEVDSVLYTTKAGEPFQASIGQHYRHVLDHFYCFFAGLTSESIDYDRRARNQQLETDIAYAGKVTEQLIQLLKTTPPATWQRECNVVYTVGYGEQAPSVIGSSLERELAFCVSHSVHHYAIIRLLCAYLRVAVPVEFGVAPSTLKYRMAQAAN